jgi:uncharacterized protein YbjT (DUF2867 family)
LGASGYVGGRLVPRLVESGYRVRCLARSPGKLVGSPWAGTAEILAGDLLRSDGLDTAFADVNAVIHLVHSMGKAASFADADRSIARNVVAAAERSGVQRIVYLGGLGEIEERTSPHLRSRAEVGQILLAARVPANVLRAAIIIGSGSASFEMLRHLTDKLPVMLTPKWVDNRIQPIAIRDVLRYLIGVLDDPSANDHVFDIGGPDVLTYVEMMQGYARVAGLHPRHVLKVPVLAPSLASHWVNLVTPVPFGLAKPLVLSLTNEVVVRPVGQGGGEDIGQLVPGDCVPYAQALELALARIRDHDVSTSWRDAEIAGRSPAEPYPGDPEWSGGVLLSDVRTAATPAAPPYVFAAVCRIGGQRGWPTHAWAWSIRGRLDRLVGGIGLRRGRRDPDRLRIGDALDFWRVEDIREPASPTKPSDSAPAGSGSGAAGLLRLRAEMRLPGRAWLEFRIDPSDGGGSLLGQRALFAPKGLPGRLYWWLLVPFHGPIFATMARKLARDAEELARRGNDRAGFGDATSSDAPTGPPEGLVEGPGVPAPQPRLAPPGG